MDAVKDRTPLDRPLVEPIYTQASPNQSVELGPCAVELEHKGKTYQDTARVTMQFAPNPRLLFVIPTEGKNPFFGIALAQEWNGKLKLTTRGITLDVLYVGNKGKHGEGLAFIPKRSPVRVTTISENIHSAVFHLFNCPAFYGPQDYILEGPEISQRCGLVVLQSQGWKITITATDHTEDLSNKLNSEGGYVITHMGRAEREDMSPFTSEQLDGILRTLHFFLSFALGCWAGVALPIGFDKTGNRVFEKWGLPIVASGRWRGAFSWFDELHAELLPQVFSGFMDLWNSEVWRSPLMETLYWYLAANERGTGITVDMKVILAQAALELLAWNYCVQHRKMVSAKAFEPRGLSAADKLRLLLSALDIPRDIPASLSALHARRGCKWKDAADAITGVRNAVMHPSVKKSIPQEAYRQAWTLGMWHLDMVLLRLCGHTGNYVNRLKLPRGEGQVEPLPWAMPKSEKADESGQHS
jgi:hypothetical protein